MTTVTFTFTDPEPTGLDRPASGSVRCALFEPQSTGGALRSTKAFHLALAEGQASAILSAGVWYIAVDGVDGAGERWVQVPPGTGTIAYTDLPMVDPASIEITPETRPVWQDLAAQVAELAANGGGGGGGGGGYIQAIQHPNYPGVLILTNDPDAVAAPTVDVAIVGLPVVGDTSLPVRVAATGAPAPAVAFSVQSQADGSWYSVAADGVGGGSYTLSGLFPIVAGEVVIRATATNRVGAATAQTTANASAVAAAAPVVTDHPQSANLSAGTTITLVAAASGFPAPTVQWQVTDDEGAWVNVAGATQAAFTTPTVTTADDGRRYRAVFRNAIGTVTTNPAVIRVTAAPAIPLVTKFPGSPGTFVFGDIIKIEADATGVPTPTVQWTMRRNSYEKVLTGQTSKTLQIIATRDAAGGYFATFTNDYGVAVADTASPVQVVPPNGAPFILAQTPASADVAPGNYLVLRVQLWLKGGDKAVWQQNNGSGWVAAEGTASETLTINPDTQLTDAFQLLRTRTLQAADNGMQYRCVLSNTIWGGVVMSNTTTVRMVSA